jgi:hypothetical protein
MKVADAELAVALAELESLKRSGGSSELALKRAELALARARLAREKATNRHHIFTHYTKDSVIKELTMALEKARSDELSRMATVELEESKEKKLERQIAACRLVAPIDGTVVYADGFQPEPPNTYGPPPVRIGEGAPVRERQPIVRIVPTSPDVPRER